ncbi:MAG: ATP phosphoribosyltransferase regulatory subunit [Peptostreptococcaceae bacterium]|nr:ATP phosphoribosyltransferase regulatory subunit [Peptostreptococcaceae bacterium]
MVLYKELFPEGVDDIHSDEYEIKENLVSDIRSMFKSYGYRQVATPTFEFYDLYLGIDGTIDVTEMFKIIDSDGKILVLRPDATIPVARMAAMNYKHSEGYLKLSYITNIFRHSESERGNRREFTQAGIEYMGSAKTWCDAEVIAMGIKMLLGFGLEDFHIDMGHAGFLGQLLEGTGIGSHKKAMLYKFIEDKNYSELSTYLERLNMDEVVKNAIIKLPRLYGKPSDVIERAEEVIVNEEMRKSLENLKAVYEILKAWGMEKYILFDLGFTNQFNYYTGVIYKGYVSNYGRVLLSGGRYDNLMEQFGEGKPACGFGFNVDQLIEVMNIYDINQAYDCHTDCYMVCSEENMVRAHALAERMRSTGMIVETDLLQNDLQFQLFNAGFRNAKHIVEFMGDEITVRRTADRAMKTYSVKNYAKLMNEPAEMMKF